MTEQLTNSNLAAALCYAQRGWSIIPIVSTGKKKKPDLKTWSPYQNQRAEEKTIRAWWGAKPQRNIGIVTGHISGLVVLDVDGEQGRASVRGFTLPATPTVQTGKGFHYYFAYPGFHVANAVGFLPGLDIRADGGYVVAPPSVHPSGARYNYFDCRRAEPCFPGVGCELVSSADAHIFTAPQSGLDPAET